MRLLLPKEYYNVALTVNGWKFGATDKCFAVPAKHGLVAEALS